MDHLHTPREGPFAVPDATSTKLNESLATEGPNYTPASSTFRSGNRLSHPVDGSTLAHDNKEEMDGGEANRPRAFVNVITRSTPYTVRGIFSQNLSGSSMTSQETSDFLHVSVLDGTQDRTRQGLPLSTPHARPGLYSNHPNRCPLYSSLTSEELSLYNFPISRDDKSDKSHDGLTDTPSNGNAGDGLNENGEMDYDDDEVMTYDLPVGTGTYVNKSIQQSRGHGPSRATVSNIGQATDNSDREVMHGHATTAREVLQSRGPTFQKNRLQIPAYRSPKELEVQLYCQLLQVSQALSKKQDTQAVRPQTPGPSLNSGTLQARKRSIDPRVLRFMYSRRSLLSKQLAGLASHRPSDVGPSNTGPGPTTNAMQLPARHINSEYAHPDPQGVESLFPSYAMQQHVGNNGSHYPESVWRPLPSQCDLSSLQGRPLGNLAPTREFHSHISSPLDTRQLQTQQANVRPGRSVPVLSPFMGQSTTVNASSASLATTRPAVESLNATMDSSAVSPVLNSKGPSDSRRRIESDYIPPNPINVDGHSTGHVAQTYYRAQLRIGDQHQDIANMPAKLWPQRRRFTRCGHDVSRSGNITAVLMQIAGNKQHAECFACRDMRGPFTKCVRLPGYAHGACANCAWNSNTYRCGFRTP